MKYVNDALIGVTGIICTGVTIEQVNLWVSLVCSVAIALVTCGIQIYRMIRDRDSDKKKEAPKDEKKGN